MCRFRECLKSDILHICIREHLSDIIYTNFTDPTQSDWDMNMSSSTRLRFNQQIVQI